jgi:subtilisin family serine protease
VERDYIVVFKKKNVFRKKNTSIKDDVKAEAEFLTKKANGKLMKTYSRAVNGFSATLTCKAMNKLHNNPDVAYIEEDVQVTVNDCATATQFPVSSWGLDRIDSVATSSTSTLDQSYSYVLEDGRLTQKVHVYVIDTGINRHHDEFVGRLGNGFNAVSDDDGAWDDCHGHGTHVAGTIGGKQYGVAKNANIILHAVRVFNCEGSGSSVGILAAYDWVIDQCTNRICVANGSFGGGFSTASNEGATKMVEAGVVFVVAAGNDGRENGKAGDYSTA